MYKMRISHIGAIGIFSLETRSPQGIVIVHGRNYPFPTDHIDDGLIFTNVVFHLLLNEGIVFEQVLKMVLAMG